MAAKSLKEALVKGATMKGYYPSAEEVRNILGEIMDFNAHSVARYCKSNNIIEFYDLLVDFVQYLNREPRNIAQEMLDEVERNLK